PASTLVPPGDRDRAAAGWRAYPAVVKPVGRLASSGVRLVTDAVELRECLAGYPPEETLLFEERATGQEFSVESLSRAGRLRYAEVTRKRTTEEESAWFVETGHTTPPPELDPAARRELLATHRAVLDRLDFGTGMAHAEYRLGPGGRPVLIEIAARPPGDSILALHWLATGAAPEDAIVGLAVGADGPLPAP
ncbi:acetyl-CoA carboxylase biotin carboxylase subunit family protein, partial [Micromonospora zhanjiangensis]